MGIDQKVMAAIQQNMNIASSPKAAIDMARSQGYQISKAQEFEILASLLNGGANMGKIGDQFDFSKPKAFEKAAKEVLKEDVAKNPSRYEEKRFDLPSGRYVVYQKDAKTGKESYKYFAANGKQIKEDYFKKQEGVFAISYDVNKNSLALTPKTDSNPAMEVVKTVVAITPLGWMGCGEKTEVPVDINIEQNVKVPITITSKDYSGDLAAIKAELQAIKGSMTKVEQNVINSYLEILAKMDTIIKDGKTTKEDFDALLRQIISLMETMEANQIAIQTENNTNFETLFALIKDIVNNATLDANTKFGKLMELLTQIKSIGQSIDAKLTTALKNDAEIIEALKKLDKNDQKTNELLNAIYTAINKLGGDFAVYFKSIILELANGNAKLDDIAALLKVINKNVENIAKLQTKYGDAGIELGNAILKAIKGLNVGGIDVKGIEELLKKIISNQGVTNDKVTNLTEMFNKYGENVNNKLNTIITLLKAQPNYDAKLTAILNAIGGIKPNGTAKDYEAQLDKIIELLGKLDNNNETRNQKVLDAIAKLGVNISEGITAILNKIGKGGNTGTAPDYSAILDAILKKLGEIQNDNNGNFAAILNAIGKINIEPQDLSWIKAHLDAILEAIKDHDVVVTVEGNKCCCCDSSGTPVHEGILGDLNDLLG